MKLPSIQALVDATRATARRFPMVLLAAVVAAAAGVVATFDGVDEEIWLRIFGVAAMGIPYYLAVGLLAERRGWTFLASAVTWVLGAVLLVSFYLSWLNWSEPVAVGRYMQVSVGLHLLVAVLPFVGVTEHRGFWQFNHDLLLRFLTAAVYSAVLYGGLAIALVAVDNLFGLEVAEVTYLRLWIVIAFLFNTWFFLGGVPGNLAALDQVADYPKGLKIFTQYMLIPIVVVYLVILTTYLGKVLVTTVWPSGWIGWLVSSVAAVGIFSLLLVHPITEWVENRWIRTYARGFYIALLPAIVMLWLAIWKRIEQYGVTEPRYFLAVLSIWLAGIAVYYAVRRSRSIKIIPASLCVAAFVTFAGPWSAYRVSESSQVRRLEGLLTRNEILREGQLQRAGAPVSFDDGKEISAILRYLISTHGTGALEGWFDGSLASVDTVTDDTGPSPPGEADERARLITAFTGVDYVSSGEARRPGSFSYAAAWREEAIPIEGYDFAWRGEGFLGDSAAIGERLTLRYDSTAAAIRLSARDTLLAEIPLQPILDSASTYRERARPDRRIPPTVMRALVDNDRVRLAVYVSNVQGREIEDRFELQTLALDLFYTIK
jgi:hypothetical protein